MTTEDRTKPLRDLLAVLDGERQPRPRKCGGAVVPVTRDSIHAMQQTLDVDFAPVDMPQTGAVDARVLCSNDVSVRPGVGGPVYAATCERCATVERRLRKLLAEAQAARAAEERR